MAMILEEGNRNFVSVKNIYSQSQNRSFPLSVILPSEVIKILDLAGEEREDWLLAAAQPNGVWLEMSGSGTGPIKFVVNVDMFKVQTNDDAAQKLQQLLKIPFVGDKAILRFILRWGQASAGTIEIDSSCTPNIPDITLYTNAQSGEVFVVVENTNATEGSHAVSFATKKMLTLDV